MGNCCRPSKQFEEIEQAETLDMVRNSNPLDDSDLIFPSKYIREDEFNKITFTENGIVNFINEILSETYTQKFQDETMKISTAEKSKFSKDFFIIRCEAKLEKSKLKNELSLKNIIDSIFDKEKRMKWDSNMKEIEIIETFSKNAILVKSVTNKILMISSREMIEKRYEFYNGNKYYNFSSSVPDNLFNINEEIVRVLSFFAINILWEDENFFFFDSINQYDIKTNIPQSIMILSLPPKMKDFIKKLSDFVNQE